MFAFCHLHQCFFHLMLGCPNCALRGCGGGPRVISIGSPGFLAYGASPFLGFGMVDPAITRAIEEREKKAREEREEKAREEREKKAREEREKKAREEREKKVREEREEKAREERLFGVVAPAMTGRRRISRDEISRRVSHALIGGRISRSASSAFFSSGMISAEDSPAANNAKQLSKTILEKQPFLAQNLELVRLITSQPTGQAVVFEGKFGIPSEKVAIKFFLNGGAESEIARLKDREVRAMRDIGTHEHILPLLYEVNKPWPIIVMPFLKPLNWQGSAMDSAVAKQYARQLASGLCYMHSKGWAHLDVKLDNVLLDSRNKLLINDFGFASEFTGADDIETCGTPPFMAPECLKDFGRPSSRAKVDTFAFGMTVWQMLTGHQPWQDVTHSIENFIYIVLEKLENNERPQISPRWDNVLVGIMQDCWKYNPEDRPSMNSVLSRLRHC